MAAVVEGVFAIMEEGLLYFDGKISKSAFYSRVLKRLGVSVARAVVISGLIVGLVTLCPFLIPVLELLALPLAIASFTLLGVRFYRLSREWRRTVSLDPSLPAELLPVWFRDWTWEPTKGVSIRAWDATKDASVWTWIKPRVFPPWFGMQDTGCGRAFKVLGSGSQVRQRMFLRMLRLGYQWFSARIWDAPDLVVNKELMLGHCATHALASHHEPTLARGYERGFDSSHFPAFASVWTGPC